MEKICGIYQIKNPMDNNKVYIGCAVDIARRWHDHKVLFKKNKHNNKWLQSIYNKYGNIFEYSIIQECSKEDIYLLEIYWVAYFNSYYKDGYGYNLTRGGEGGSMPGVPKSNEWKAKMKGKKHPWSESQREKSSGKNHHNFGKPMPDHIKEKLKKILTGVPRSNEVRLKIGLSNKGKKRSKDFIIRSSLSKIGIKSAKNSSSKYVGVSYDKSRNKWMSGIQINGKYCRLGRFQTEIEAALAYNESILDLFGYKVKNKVNIISQEEINKMWEDAEQYAKKDI